MKSLKSQSLKGPAKMDYAVLFVVLSMSFVAISQANAQGAYSIDKSKSIEVSVSGSSNLHDWSMKSSSLTCDCEFTFQSSSATKLQSLDKLDFSVAVTDLKSDKSLMDSKAYEALKADQYNKISFKLTSATVAPYKDSKFIVKTTGNLTLAGVTKSITMNVIVRVNTDQSLTCIGSKDLLMSDYGVDAPTAMMGALKTSDNVTVAFTIELKKSSGI